MNLQNKKTIIILSVIGLVLVSIAVIAIVGFRMRNGNSDINQKLDSTSQDFSDDFSNEESDRDYGSQGLNGLSFDESEQDVEKINDILGDIENDNNSDPEKDYEQFTDISY